MHAAFWRTSALAALCVSMTASQALSADAPKVGDKAPEFSLKATDGKTYSLADFKGKSPVILAWFPKADTPGCTKECKSFNANGKALKDLNVAYFTASVDNVQDNVKFAEKFDFKFPILSDPDKSVATAYGVLGPRGVAQRWTFYIDKDGVIREIDKSIKTEQAADDAAKKVKALGLAKN